MASAQHPWTIENLPDGVLSDIFKRLLAKQVGQMRCICKSWNALLSDSDFIKSHLHRSIHNNDEILLFFNWENSFDYSSITARPSCSLNQELTDFIKLPVNPQIENSSCNVIGSVNGLICFYYQSLCLPYDDSAVYIWNPSLSMLLTLPPCSLPYDFSMNVHFRFGFDPKTEDYKVVKLTSLVEPRNMLPQIEVYSMRKGSWELITQRFPSHITMIRNDDKVCLDGHEGHLHWLGFIDLEPKPQMIVAFDLSAETLSEIPLPEAIRDCFNVLGVLGGKLCVMSSVEYGEWEVWVMDEYWVAESWIKHHYTFPQFSGDVKPYGFTSRSEFLYQAPGDCFGLYDPVADTTKTFEINRASGVYTIVEYVDSLVWVVPAGHELSKWHIFISVLKRHQLHVFYVLLPLLFMMLCSFISFLF